MGGCWSLGQTSNSPILVRYLSLDRKFLPGRIASEEAERPAALIGEGKRQTSCPHNTLLRISYRVSPIAKTDTVDFDFLAKKLCPAMDLHQFADRKF